MKAGVLGALVLAVTKTASEQEGLMQAHGLKVLFIVAKKVPR